MGLGWVLRVDKFFNFYDEVGDSVVYFIMYRYVVGSIVKENVIEEEILFIKVELFYMKCKWLCYNVIFI